MATRALQQVVTYLAWNTSTNAYVTGDSANHSTSWCKDGTRSATSNATAEVDSTNLPGLYKVTMTSTETDCIEGVLGGKSSTSNVVLIPTMVAFDYLNTSAPATAGIPDVNAKNLGNTAQTGRDIGASVLLSAGSGAGQLDFTSGVVKANLAQILGTALTETAGQIAAAFKQFFNIASPTSTMNVITSVASVSGAVGSVTGNVGGNVTGSVGSVTARVTANTDQLAGQTVTAAAGVTFPGSVASPTNITAGTITTATNLTNAPTAGDLTAAMKTSVENAVWDATQASHVTAGTTGKSLSTAGAAADPWATALPGAYGAGTAGAIIGGNLDAKVSTRYPTIDAGASLTSLGDTRIANLDTTVSSRASPAQILTTALTESYPTLHGTATLTQLLAEIRALLAEKGVSGTTLTTKKWDGSTTAETYTLDSATAPTTISRAS